MKKIKLTLFVLFFASGFSGLIYESIWSHYLKLFLGHAAYAQTLVVAIFMGGLALGSIICSLYSLRWKNVLLLYAIAEAVIGILAIGFHDIFSAFTAISYNSLIPAIGSPGLVSLFKWLSASLLILPQSILLGMTFPLMSAAIIRAFPRKQGESLSVLYFTNSLGAVSGVLVSGFFLIKNVGLPGSMLVAGVINIAIALCVFILFYLNRFSLFQLSAQENIEQKINNEISSIAVESSINKHTAVLSPRVFLLIAFITGLSSFIYEISWIRMLSLVLSSSTHAFELMLSAFILGLAGGGYWIKSRIDKLENPAQFLAIVQVVMGLFALSTLVIYNHTFELMQFVLQVLSRTEEAYIVYNFSSHVIALSIMLPTTFCAGMTLPLITFTLLKLGNGEKSIGAVYASNTFGAILGVFFTVHFGLPFMGLQNVVFFAVLLDVGLGLVLLWYLGSMVVQTAAQKRRLQMFVGVCLVTMVVTNTLVEFDSYKMASGVYRWGKIIDSDKTNILFHQDGKTASIDLIEYPNKLIAITTNGKSDAAINMRADRPASRDEATMVLAAALPLALNPAAKTAANIGLGSGLTAHTLLTVPWLEKVDTIEIEQAIVDAAQGFRPRVELVYSDPRSHIHIEDAKTFFSSHNEQYDIIISEPSNPWVSGVSGLFSDEFYWLIKKYMSEEGLLVQWLQLYEIDINLVASVMKAFSRNFSDYVIYASDTNNILIVGKKTGKLNEPDFRVFEEIKLATELNKISINSIQDFKLHKVGNKKSLDPFFQSFNVVANSDYYPVLDQSAAKTRFLGLNAEDVVALANAPLPIISFLENDFQSEQSTAVSHNPYITKSVDIGYAISIRNLILTGTINDTDLPLTSDIIKDVQLLKLHFQNCESFNNTTQIIDSLLNIFVAIIPYLNIRELDSIWERLRVDTCTTISNEQKMWVTLIKALTARDIKSMKNLAESMLTEEDPKNVMRYGYLFMTAMLSNILLEDKEASKRLWDKYSPQLYGKSQLDTLLLLLAAHSILE